MDQQKFFNYYTELLNRTVQDLFNKSIILQANEKMYLEELGILKKKVDDFSQARSEDEKESEIIRLQNELGALKLENQRLIGIQSNADTYRIELQKAQERIKELESEGK